MSPPFTWNEECTSTNFNNFNYFWFSNILYVSIYECGASPPRREQHRFLYLMPFRRLDHLVFVTLEILQKKIIKRNQFPIILSKFKDVYWRQDKKMVRTNFFFVSFSSSLERSPFLYLLLYYLNVMFVNMYVGKQEKVLLLLLLCDDIKATLGS